MVKIMRMNKLYKIISNIQLTKDVFQTTPAFLQIIIRDITRRQVMSDRLRPKLFNTDETMTVADVLLTWNLSRKGSGPLGPKMMLLTCDF